MRVCDQFFRTAKLYATFLSSVWKVRTDLWGNKIKCMTTRTLLSRLTVKGSSEETAER